MIMANSRFGRWQHCRHRGIHEYDDHPELLLSDAGNAVPGGRFDENGSRGSIYGWLRGNTGNESGCSGVLEDVYWLSGFKAGAVSRPSTATAYESFLDALNASASAYNAGSPTFDVQAAEWVMGTNGYPVPLEF